MESALAQTYRDIEVIVMDDGSTDGSLEVLRDLNDRRLRLVRQSHAGSACARNAGLRLVTGDLVAFLDGDDKWAPRNLEQQAAVLTNRSDLDLTFGHSLVIGEDGQSLGFKCSSWTGPLDLPHLLRANEIGNGSCVLVRRQALDQAGWFNPRLSCCVDLDLFVRIANLRPGNIEGIPEVLTFYRRRRGQISGDWRRMEAGYVHLLEELRRVMPLLIGPEQNRSRAARYRYYARLAFENGQCATGIRLFATALCWAPMWMLTDFTNWEIGAVLLCRRLLPRRLFQRAVRYSAKSAAGE